MKLRHVGFFLLGFIPATLFNYYAHGAEAKKEELPCASNKDIEKIMNDKGYALLLNMTRKEDNKDGIIETVWIGGQNIVVTATVPKGETSCLIANMGNVIVNPETVEAIWNNYKKQTNQKDI
jgi:hypothetical protein